MEADILIRNGWVIDPKNHINEIKDIAIKDGHICDLKDVDKARSNVDASGLLVLPGLIDFHTHVFESASIFGVHGDLLIPTGVSTIVDMGTAGYKNFDQFKENEIKHSLIDIKCFLNVSPVGIPGGSLKDHLDEDEIDEEATINCALVNKDLIKGIKVRLNYENVGDDVDRVIRHGLNIAEKSGLPLCIHSSGTTSKMSDLLKYLRKGDILSHIYHNVRNSIVVDDKLIDDIFLARKRGVLFDVGSSRRNLSFDTLLKCVDTNFWPDFISSDVTPSGMFRSISLKDIPHLMSLFLSLKMDINDVVASVTANPAKMLNDETIGNLSIGSKANVSIFKLNEKETIFGDCDYKLTKGNKEFVSRMTIKDGIIVYNASDFYLFDY